MKKLFIVLLMLAGLLVSCVEPVIPAAIPAPVQHHAGAAPAADLVQILPDPAPAENAPALLLLSEPSPSVTEETQPAAAYEPEADAENQTSAPAEPEKTAAAEAYALTDPDLAADGEDNPYAGMTRQELVDLYFSTNVSFGANTPRGNTPFYMFIFSRMNDCEVLYDKLSGTYVGLSSVLDKADTVLGFEYGPFIQDIVVSEDRIFLCMTNWGFRCSIWSFDYDLGDARLVHEWLDPLACLRMEYYDGGLFYWARVNDCPADVPETDARKPVSYINRIDVTDGGISRVMTLEGNYGYIPGACGNLLYVPGWETASDGRRYPARLDCLDMDTGGVKTVLPASVLPSDRCSLKLDAVAQGGRLLRVLITDETDENRPDWMECHYWYDTLTGTLTPARFGAVVGDYEIYTKNDPLSRHQGDARYEALGVVNTDMFGRHHDTFFGEIYVSRIGSGEEQPLCTVFFGDNAGAQINFSITCRLFFYDGKVLYTRLADPGTTAPDAPGVGSLGNPDPIPCASYITLFDLSAQRDFGCPAPHTAEWYGEPLTAAP